MDVLCQDEPMEELGETLDTFFGVRVVQNTKVPLGTAIVMDTALAVKAFTRMGLELMTNQWGDSVFSTYGIQFRCVERIALAVIRPTSICVVSGMPSYSQGNS
jgi:hypothetical protein